MFYLYIICLIQHLQYRLYIYYNIYIYNRYRIYMYNSIVLSIYYLSDTTLFMYNLSLSLSLSLFLSTFTISSHIVHIMSDTIYMGMHVICYIYITIYIHIIDIVYIYITDIVLSIYYTWARTCATNSGLSSPRSSKRFRNTPQRPSISSTCTHPSKENKT